MSAARASTRRYHYKKLGRSKGRPASQTSLSMTSIGKPLTSPKKRSGHAITLDDTITQMTPRTSSEEATPQGCGDGWRQGVE
jgi:hypothetical protein